MDDALVDETSCGGECASLVRRVVNTVDKSCPAVMKALWA